MSWYHYVFLIVLFSLAHYSIYMRLYRKARNSAFPQSRADSQPQGDELIFVGYTNGYQILYAKKSEGLFYNSTDGDCYIPLYMLKAHAHRIESTSCGDVTLDMVTTDPLETITITCEQEDHALSDVTGLGDALRSVEHVIIPEAGDVRRRK